MRLVSRIAMCLMVGTGVASATPIPTDRMYVVEPESMTEAAKTTTMPWCDTPFTGEKWTEERILRIFRAVNNLDQLADSLVRACEFKSDPTWVKQATYVVQYWMNYKRSTQAEAEADIKKHIAKLQREIDQANKPVTDEDRFAFSENALTPKKPVNGAEQASITGTVPWCDGVKVSDRWDPHRIEREVGTGYTSSLVKAAAHICQRPNDKTWKIEAGYIAQQWMNWTKQSQADAIKSLHARVLDQKWSADRDAVCKALEISPEITGSAKVYGQARRQLFACDDNSELWSDRTHARLDEVVFYLDAETQPDPLLSMYALFNLTSSPYKSSYEAIPSKSADNNAPLLFHAIAQYDYARLDGIAKQLDQAPYNNDYARTIINELVSTLKNEHAAYEAAADQLAKNDADYKAILRDTAKKGWDAWDKAAAQWRDELDRSNAFEKLLSRPSRKVLKGCSPALQKDAEKLIKSYKLHDHEAIKAKLASDPIAVILLSRLAVCDAVDGVYGQAGALKDIISRSRDLRGPRSSAYYAIFDALNEVRKDRPQFLLSTHYYSWTNATLIKPYDGFNYSGAAITDWGRGYDRGVIKSLKKVEDGVLLTFKTVKITWENQSCNDDTSHPLKIESGGRIVYAQHCKGLGTTSSQDVTSDPIVLHPSVAAALKPGQYVVFVDTRVKAKSGDDFGVAAFSAAKSGDKKILSFYGFHL